MKYKFLVLALVPLFAVFLTACSLQELPVVGKFFSPKEDTSPVTLNFWGMWEPSSVYEPVIASYKEKKSYVSVNYENRALGGDIYDYKNRIFQGSQTGSAPDIYMVHNGWVPRFAALGLFSPAPDDIASKLNMSERYYKVASDSGVVDGKVYAVPAYYDGLALVYNKSHFKDVNQTSPPTTWEEFRVLALKLTVRGEDDVLLRSGAAVGGANNIDHFSDVLGLLWAQANVKIPEDIDSERAVDALAFYTSFYTEDKIWNDDMPESITSFVRGQTSMLLVPSWQVLNILNEVPNASDVGVAPAPQVPRAAQQANWGTFWMYAVPANSPHKDLAWDFLLHLSDPAQAKAIYSNQSKIRKFGAPYAHIELAKDLSANPYVTPYLAGAPTAKSAEIAGRSGNRNQVAALQGVINDIINDVATPEEALAKAKNTLLGR
jgi:multiple sugar transport system substrate-binding protein